MPLPPPPDSRELLPPLLACLPTAFVSPRPPPALLPLLSPVLRQRVNFLASNGASRGDGWLPLLSWDGERAAKLPDVIERMHLEPHPVSGEVEMDDVRPAKYRRLDEETLQARLEVEQFELVPIYVWCENDEHGGTGPGWKLSELMSLEDMDSEAEWFETPSEANDAAIAKRRQTLQPSSGMNGRLPAAISHKSEDDDDSDYWAAYDRTPGRGTPAQKHSPAPPSAAQASNRQRTQSELEYFARYGAEVQPALDSHDPDEDNSEIGQSSLTGDSLVRSRQQQQQRPESRPNGNSMFPADSGGTGLDARQDLEAPRAISPTSSHGSVERLEEKAAAMNDANDRAHFAIKQHISTDIKSLFRLAKNSGMERHDFERIVKTELECLTLLEQDE